MKGTLKVFAWSEIVIGALAVLGSIGNTYDGYGLVGGALFIAAGVVALKYIGEVEGGGK